MQRCTNVLEDRSGTNGINFNEGSDLEAAVEDYFRKFGCNPSAVLADRIYQTRHNKMFCAQLGIRLSGPPLGRRKVSETASKIKRQIYKDGTSFLLRTRGMKFSL